MTPSRPPGAGPANPDWRTDGLPNLLARFQGDGGKRRAGIFLLGRRGIESYPCAPAAPQTVMKIVTTL